MPFASPDPVFRSPLRERCIALQGIDPDESYRQLQLEIRVGGRVLRRLLRTMDLPWEAPPRVGTSLTSVERRVLEAFADGGTSPSVGDSLGISASMVHDHLAYARTRLVARNTTHAVAIGIRAGMISPPTLRRGPS